MKVVRAVGMALTGALMAVLAAVPAQADEAEVWAFLYADRPEAQETYKPVYRNASDGVEVEVTKVTTGTYTVHLDEGGADDGVPMVTAINDGPVHCQVASYGPDDDDEDIAVNCYRGTARVNSAFTLSFFSSAGEDDLTGAYGYVRNNRPTATSYTNPPSYNSTGEDVTINRANGIWTVHFEGAEFANVAGNVQVTALGTLPARCSVVGWNGAGAGVDVRVRCGSLSGGTPPQWTLVYAHERSIVGNLKGFFGYLQANEPTSSFYTPNPDRNLAPNGLGHTVTRGETGRYEAQVYGPVKEPVGVHVTVNGETDRFCVLTGATVHPAPTQPAARVQIACYTAAGQLADSWFTLNYYSP